MRFTVQTQALAEGLGWVSRSLPARPAVPVLAGVKIEVRDGDLYLSAFDYEQSAGAAVEVAVGVDDGTAIVPGRMLAEIVRNLPKGEAEVFIDGARLRVVAGRARFALPLLPVDEYPALPGLPAPTGLISSDAFADAVRQVAPAAGKDDSLPMLTAVLVEVDPVNGYLTFAATDRYRLAVKKVEFEPSEGAQAQDLLVPARTLDGYAKTLTASEDVTLHVEGDGAGTFAVSAAARTATSRLLDSDFPKFRGLIPTEFAAEARVPTRALADAVKRVGLVAERNAPCRLTFDQDSVLVEAGKGEEADASETLDENVSYTGAEPMTIAFNFGYLADGLAAVNSNEVSIGLVAPLKPAVLRPATDGVDDYSYLIMPVRVNG